MSKKQPWDEAVYFKKFDQDYDYNTLISDAVSPAIEGLVHLETGILELEQGFNSLYGTNNSFDDVLQFYGKTTKEFEQDCQSLYRKKTEDPSKSVKTVKQEMEM